MTGGFVGDVLGFSSLVGADPSGDRIQQYLASLRRATEPSAVDYVVFSDSIVLTAKGDGPEAFIAIAGACSRLLSELLNEGIALRGAIAFGNFIRSAVGESVFVAGRAVIDAYQFEQAKDWVGIMVAPSAIARVPNLEARCLINCNDLPEFLGRIQWAAFVQPSRSIPFHSSNPLASEFFDGFAVVPTIEVTEPPLASLSRGYARRQRHSSM